MDLLLLRGQWKWTRGRIRGVLGTAAIVGVAILVAIVFPDRESSGWGVYDTGGHWRNDDGRRKGGGREARNAVVMALKKGCVAGSQKRGRELEGMTRLYDEAEARKNRRDISRKIKTSLTRR
jgi:hypothetical protein